MKLTQSQIDAIRDMTVPKLNEDSEYSDGYSDALDDVVAMLEEMNVEAEAPKSHTGNFV